MPYRCEVLMAVSGVVVWSGGVEMLRRWRWVECGGFLYKYVEPPFDVRVSHLEHSCCQISDKMAFFPAEHWNLSLHLPPLAFDGVGMRSSVGINEVVRMVHHEVFETFTFEKAICFSAVTYNGCSWYNFIFNYSKKGVSVSVFNRHQKT